MKLDKDYILLNEIDSKKLLESVGISIPKGYFVPFCDISSPKTYITTWDKMYNTLMPNGFDDEIYKQYESYNRYVIKIVSTDIIHKSNYGGVLLNIAPSQIATECWKMIENIQSKLPDVKISGIYIEEMVSPGVETIIGIKTDSQFGKVIMFGMGGIYTEIYKDISMRILPITKDDIREMIQETKIYKILSGARGKVYDIEAITNALIKVSSLADSKNIKELDINPLVVHENGVKALDARIML